MKTVYHKTLGYPVFPGMVSSSSAEFVTGVVERPGEGLGNNMINGIAIGQLAGRANGASHNSVAPSNAISSGVYHAWGVVVATGFRGQILMQEPENNSNAYPDGKPIIAHIPVGEECNILVSGKVWILTERATGTIEPPFTPVYAFHGWARNDLNNASNKTPFFFTGVPGVEYEKGMWLQEIFLP